MATVDDKFLGDLKSLFDNLTKTCKIPINTGDIAQQSGDSNEVPNWEENVELIISKIDDMLPKVTPDGEEFMKLLAMKASIMYEKAKIYLGNSLMEKCQEMLLNALCIIEHYSAKPMIRFLYLRIINHLAYGLSRKGDCEKAKELLEKVNEEVVTEMPLIYSTEELFTGETTDQSQAEYKLNKLIINNMQMLGWVYGKLGLYDSHTAMQHKTLQKQLDLNDAEPLQWSLRCSRLASLFLGQCQWVKARYYLSAAQTVLDQLEMEDVESNTEFVKTQADVSKCLMYYALHLFGMSKKSIIEAKYAAGAENFTIFHDQPPTPEEELPESFKFTNLEVKIVQIPATHISTTQQAKELFALANKWVKRIQFFYNLRDFPLEYVNVIFDLSELYKYVAFYEPDLDAQYSVQKRRADSLESLCSLLKEIIPSCYLSVSVELFRELSEVQIELMGINLKRLYKAEQTTLSEANLKRRISAVRVIHQKLANVSDMMNNIELENAYETSEPRAKAGNFDENKFVEEDEKDISTVEEKDENEETLDEGKEQNSDLSDIPTEVPTEALVN